MRPGGVKEMSERKVLNKYIPPNFDPSRIPKGITPKAKQHTVRLMTPFSMRCNTCGEYIYKGRKFNARKETVENEMYLTIKIFRFYIRCPICAAEITFKTDPKNADYVAEHGAKRNFEPWREELKETEEAKTKRILEEMNNPMKALENKTFDSKREMEIMEGLDEIRMLNTRLEKVDTDSVFVKVATERRDEIELKRKLEEDEDEEEIAKAFAVKRKQLEPVEFEPLSDEEIEEEIIEELPAPANPTDLINTTLSANGIYINSRQKTSEATLNPVQVINNPSLTKSKKQTLLGIKRKSA